LIAAVTEIALVTVGSDTEPLGDADRFVATVVVDEQDVIDEIHRDCIERLFERLLGLECG
jgi:hypothetical protein